MEKTKKESAKKELKEMQEYYINEIERKDKIIGDLKQANEILLRTALKQSEKAAHFSEKLDEVMGKNKKRKLFK